MSDTVADRLTPEEVAALGWSDSELGGYDEDAVKELGKNVV